MGTGGFDTTIGTGNSARIDTTLLLYRLLFVDDELVGSIAAIKGAVVM
jgi:hypothetical protein